MSKSPTYYKNLFIIAALWNLGAAIPLWLGGVFIPDLTFGIYGITPPTTLFPYHAMFWFIMAFGIGYLIVSCDITKNHGIVVIGIIAKVLFLLDCIITVVLKEANLLLLFPGIVDFIFAMLFLEFLLSAKKGLLKA